jgi:hypothetical protein
VQLALVGLPSNRENSSAFGNHVSLRNFCGSLEQRGNKRGPNCAFFRPASSVSLCWHVLSYQLAFHASTLRPLDPYRPVTLSTGGETRAPIVSCWRGSTAKGNFQRNTHRLLKDKELLFVEKSCCTYEGDVELQRKFLFGFRGSVLFLGETGQGRLPRRSQRFQNTN